MAGVESLVSGRVVAVHVNQGAQVNAGDVLFVVESMKMEIPVEAERTGVVAEIKVKVDDAVEEGQIVMVLA